MTDVAVSVAGHRVPKLRVEVPNRGAWVADADFDEAVEVTGRVEIKLGSLKLSGTVDPSHSGIFSGARRIRVVAGSGRWGKVLKEKGYHNDLGVKRATVAQDAAREAGETLGSFLPPAERAGPQGAVDYVRPEGPASVVLEDLLGTTPWWVDYAGVTHGAARPSAPAGQFDLLAFDPRDKLATLAVDDPATVGIGSVLTDSRLSGPQTVRSFELFVQAQDMRVHAWCGGDEATDSRIARVLRAMVRQLMGGKLFGLWRYRVTEVASDGRVKLQVARRAAGLPDVLPVTMRPGVAGCWSDLSVGSEVLVEFIEGDRAQPIITHFEGDKDGHKLPTKTIIDAAETVQIGRSAPKGAARQEDTVVIMLPPAVFQGSINGMPAVGMVIWSPGQTTGQITTCSGTVKVGG